MLPLMERWQAQCTLIAPDTPGYGMSDPFGPGEVSIDDIADGVVEFLDALGVERTAVYGFHTGAMIAAALAANHAPRVSGVVANGFVVLDDDERRDILENYLPPFEPRWDGGHLTWLWARLREQTIFFPWYRPTRAARMKLDVPAPDLLQAAAVDFLRSGDNYRKAYRAAFDYRGEDALRSVRAPLMITAAEVDPLHASLARLGTLGLPATVELRSGGSLESTLDRALEFLDRHPAPEPPSPPPTKPIPGRMWNEMVTIEGGQLRVRRNLEAAGRTVIVQHDAASASDTVDPVSASLIGRRPVLAIDLPGHGESDALIPLDEVTVPAYVAAVWQALQSLGIDEIDAYGMWGGGLVPLEMALQRPQRVAHLVMSDGLHFDDALRAELAAHYTPAIEPDWYGGHLLHAWHLMRDQGLFWPWYRRTHSAAVPGEPHVDTAMVHLRVVNLFKAPQMWRRAYQAHFAYPTGDALKKVRVPAMACAASWSPQLEHTRRAALERPGLDYRDLPDEMSQWGSVILDFMEGRSTAAR
jgi:pimeloyl-ACP methyl ester carboxylesterase